MEWLIFVAITVVFDSSRIFIDNYISDVYFDGHTAVSQKYYYAYLFVILAAVIMLITGVDFSAPLPLLLFTASGIMSSLAGIPYYRALELDDSTNLGIFMQLAPVLYLILGWLFLGDSFSAIQLAAFALILSAPLLIVATTKKRSRKIKIKAVLYAFLFVTIAVTGNFIFVKQNATHAELNFFTEMAFVFLGKGLGNFLILAFKPKWCRRFRTVAKRNKKIFRPLTTSAVFSITKDFTYRAALTLAPSAAIASAASDSSEPIVIFFMGLILTLISPKIGREKLAKKPVIIHLIATALVVTGVILLRKFS